MGWCGFPGRHLAHGESGVASRGLWNMQNPGFRWKRHLACMQLVGGRRNAKRYENVMDRGLTRTWRSTGPFPCRTRPAKRGPGSRELAGQKRQIRRVAAQLEASRVGAYQCFAPPQAPARTQRRAPMAGGKGGRDGCNTCSKGQRPAPVHCTMCGGSDAWQPATSSAAARIGVACEHTRIAASARSASSAAFRPNISCPLPRFGRTPNKSQLPWEAFKSEGFIPQELSTFERLTLH